MDLYHFSFASSCLHIHEIIQLCTSIFSFFFSPLVHILQIHSKILTIVAIISEICALFWWVYHSHSFIPHDSRLGCRIWAFTKQFGLSLKKKKNDVKFRLLGGRAHSSLSKSSIKQTLVQLCDSYLDASYGSRF